MHPQRGAPSGLGVQASLLRRRRPRPFHRRNAQGRLRRKNPAQPAQPVVIGPPVAGDGAATAGVLVRRGRFKTDCSPDQEEPIYLEQDCNSCTKYKQFEDFLNC